MQRKVDRARSLHDMFAVQAASWPHRTAVIFDEQRLSYRELDERSNRLANHLRRLGVGRETLVAVCLDRSADVIVAILAILKAGGAYVPLDPAHSDERLAFYLSDSRAPIVLSMRSLGRRWPDQQIAVLLDADDAVISAEPAKPPDSITSPDDLAYIIYTSGSTGKPKGVMVSHHNVIRLFRATERWFSFDERDVWTLFHSYAFDFSVWEIWGALLHGGRLVVVSHEQSSALHRFAQLIWEQGVTVLSQTPSAFRQLMPILIEEVEETALRYVVFGGEMLDFTALRPWIERFGDARPALINMYGITETTVHSTYRRVTRDDVTGSAKSLIGVPLPDLEILLLDQNLEAVPFGQIGEIFISGEGLARGYLGRPELTEERYPTWPRDGRRLYRSGDLARCLPDGVLEYLGRIDAQVKIRGFRIELGEITARLFEHPGVEDAAVITGGESSSARLIAYVVPKTKRPPDARDLQRALSRRLPDYMVPSAIVFVERLPLTVNGKLDRAALPPPRLDIAGYRAPATPVARLLARLFVETLHMPQVGLDDGFLALGGDSLRATRILWNVEKELGVALPLGALLEARTLGELAARVEQEDPSTRRNVPSSTKQLPRDRPLPLSPAQEQIWLHLLHAPRGEPIYNETLSIHVRGDLDEPALRSAVRRLIRRHEALRATFIEADGAPEKRIHPEADCAWLSVDLRAAPKPEREAEARRLAGEVARRPFDLALGPLLRLTLVRLGDDEAQIFVTFHHIIMDGVGMTVFFSDLEQEYRSILAGRSPLPLPGLKEADHAARQRAAVPAARTRHLAYWQKQLENLPELELPTDRPRPPSPSFRGKSFQRALPHELVGRVRAAAVSIGVTAYQIFLAAFVAFLERHTHREEIVLGGLTSGRARLTESAILGCFLNSVVLRIPFAGLRSFRDLVFCVRDVSAAAYEHQDLPFHEVVAALQPSRDRSKNPFFQVMFASEPPAPRSALGWEFRYMAEIDRGTSRLDLIYELMEFGDDLWLMIEYSADLFDLRTMERMLERYLVLLSGAVDSLKSPDEGALPVPLSALPVLTPAEREQIARLAGSDAPYPALACIHHLVEAQTARRRASLAAVCDGGSLSYGELDARANKLAHLLRQLGVGPFSRVGICLERSLDLLVAILGVLKAGGAYVPLDPAYPEARLSFMLEDAEILVLVTERGARAALPETRARVVLLNEEREAIALESEAPPRSDVGPDDIAYVIYTSGSTGRPKGVLVPHRGVVNLAPVFVRMFDVHPDSRVLAFTSPSFDVSVMEVIMTLAAGATLVLAPRNDILPGLPLRKVLSERRVTIASLPPSALSALDSEGDTSKRSLPVETFIAAGEALPAQIVSRFGPGRRFFNLYGPTETTIGATIGECSPDGSKPSIGRPLPNTRCFVLDAHMQPVPIGVPGELYIGGVGVAHGYLGRPALTAERFVPNPFGGGRLYKTGDRVLLREEGDLYFLGRLDAQIKLRGFRIELGEIEAELGQHPHVRAAAVKLLYTAASDPMLAAYVIPRPDAPRDLASTLKSYLRERLPEPMVPSAIMTLDDLPVGPSGKIDRAALPEPPPPSHPPALPTTGIERAIAEVWRQVLGLDAVGIDDPFFEVGGHSLALARVQALLRARLGVEVDVVALLGLPTIRRLAAHVAGLSLAAPSDAEEEAKVTAEVAPAETPERPEPIAIVGMAIRAPGVRDARALWDVLREGRETVTTLDPAALIAAGADPGRVRQAEFVPREGVLDDADRFDAALFGYTDADAAFMDPQQRLFLECAEEALEDAGCDPARFNGRVGVFGGAGAPRHWMGPVAARLRESGSELDGYRAMTLNAPDFLATRVAFKLGLKGPAITVQTACSTSLAAIHLACKSLIAGECDMALSGGVSLASLGEADQGYLHAEGGILSADGRCRPFDAEANGTVKSSGVAIVALKRLSSALADGSTIHALIVGSAMNNDGARAKVGFTAPSEEGIEEAVTRAYATAGVDPDSIAFVEAHGTGTRLGDPTEVRALSRAFRRWTNRRGSCALGSVKANLGHLDAAAGAAGLIKAALSLRQEVIPPTPGFRAENPLLNLSETPFYVNSAPVAWPRAGSPRRAGVSAMGVGGTNVHVVLEEAPPAAPSPGGRPFQLLCLSARTPTALAELAGRLHTRLSQAPSLALPDVAHTLALGRAERAHRAAIVAENIDEARRALAEVARGARSPCPASPRPAVFLFPGHGVQYPGMGRALYDAEPGYRAEVDRCLGILREESELELAELLLGEAPDDDPRLDEMQFTQPLLFTVEYALGRQLLGWGVRPAAMLGHSLGEYVAACLADVLSLRDALALVVTRGRLMDRTPPGGMLTVFGDERAVRPHLGEGVVIATYAPGCVVLSGPSAAIKAQRALFMREGIETTGVRVTRASHSPLMEPIRGDLLRRAAKAALGAPKIPVISNVTGAELTAKEAQSPEYFADHLTRPVRLAEGLGALLDLAPAVFLELGPGTTLGSFLKGHPRRAGDGSGIVATMPPHARRDEPAHAALLRALGYAWELGVEIDWSAFHGHEAPRRIPLPTYPFEGKSYSLAARPRPAPRDLDTQTSDGIRERGVRGVDSHPGLRDRLMELCASLSLDFFRRRLGEAARRAHSIEELRESAGILPSFLPMVSCMAELSSREGLARKTLDGQRLYFSSEREGRSAELAARLRQDHPGFAGLVRFIEHCAGHYDEALTGKIEPVGVLYPDATDAFYLACMSETDPYKYDDVYLDAAQEAVLDIVAERRGQKTRILEIGAGHGRLTWPLVERLRGGSVDYHFTDIGRSFLRNAEAETERRGLPFLRCSQLDLNRLPEEPHPDERYDIILGYNAAHVAIDLPRTLLGLHGMLSPRGAMLLVELTRTEPWDYLTFGLAPGFWDIERARGGSLGMALARWEEALLEAGFASVRIVPREEKRRAEEDHGLVIASRGRGAESAARPARSAVESAAQRPLVSASIARAEAQAAGHAPPSHVRAKASPRAKAGLVAPEESRHAPDDAEELVRGIWRRLLGVTEVPPGASFFDLGGDSLLTVQLLAEVSVRTAQPLKRSALASDPTVEGVAALLRADPQAQEAKERSADPNSALLGAGKMGDLTIRGTTTVTVPGDHFSMLSSENVVTLARQIDRALTAADDRARIQSAERGEGSPERAEESVRAYLQRFEELTYVGGDVLVKELFARAEKSVLFDVSEGVHEGDGAIGAHLEREFLAYRDLSMRVYDQRISVFAGGQAACATALLDSEMTLVRSGRRVRFGRVRMTWVLERSGEAWRAVHVHSSLPVGEPLWQME